MKLRKKLAGSAFAVALTLGLGIVGAAPATAAINPTTDASAVAKAITANSDSANVTGASFKTLPPNGTPVAVSTTKLALFPLAGNSYGILSTGNAAAADSPNDSDSTSTDNGGDGGGHSTVANDLVTLQLDINVPDDRNCLTIDYRFLSEEFPEFIGSQFNDAFLIELDNDDFDVSGSGVVTAPSNFAFGPDGNITTINAAGTSADNAIGTTYDGATPVLRATTPITPGPHTVYLSIYDASDQIYDSSAFIDNLLLRNVAGNDCKRGAAPGGNENTKCQGKDATVIASGGVATGTKGKDVIVGSEDDDIIRGRGGDDIICGGSGDDKINGNAGDDSIVGNSGDDKVFGNGGDDEIKGLRDRDELHGQSGDDVVRGGNNDDKVLGGGGNDRLSGNRGNDFVRGGPGDDDLQGNKDEDKLNGGDGTDECRGGTGDDKRFNCERKPASS